MQYSFGCAFYSRILWNSWCVSLEQSTSHKKNTLASRPVLFHKLLKLQKKFCYLCKVLFCQEANWSYYITFLELAAGQKERQNETEFTRQS